MLDRAPAATAPDRAQHARLALAAALQVDVAAGPQLLDPAEGGTKEDAWRAVEILAGGAVPR